jgi:ectoine hydroxylase-related dioxygenase (phytanoyl-CoA dioxygenase family)
MNSTVLDVTAALLAHAKAFQLSVTEIVRIGPGSAAQELHRDSWDFEGFPIPLGYESSLSTMWALTDFTEMNGATRVVPGSHKLKGRQQFGLEDSEPAEMEAGSVLLYTGSLFHGAGANRSGSHREGLIVHYNLGWLRQVENQYLSVTVETLRELPEDLLRLMGYTRGDDMLGYVDVGRDPIIAVRPEFERPMFELREYSGGREAS